MQAKRSPSTIQGEASDSTTDLCMIQDNTKHNGQISHEKRCFRMIGNIYATTYHEAEIKFIKITTYLKKWWPRIVFLEGTNPEYIDQIVDYNKHAEHDDAPDSAACVCRILDKEYY